MHQAHLTWDQPIRRQRTLVRALAGRLYVGPNGKLCVVSGKPVAPSLLKTLHTFPQVPRPEQVPLPEVLGLASRGELSESLLATMQGALVEWRHALEHYEATHRGDWQQIERSIAERRELTHLQARLQHAFEMQRKLRAGKLAAEGAFLFSPEDERAFAVLLTKTEAQHWLPPLERWLARLVMWLSGVQAAERFLQAAARLVDVNAVRRATAALENLWEHLHVLLRRSATESPTWLLAELTERLLHLPAGLVGLPSKRQRRGGFADLCTLLIERCERLLAGDVRLAVNYVPAALATVAACDGGAAPLPAELFRIRRTNASTRTDGSTNAVLDIANQLAALSSQPGFERLLQFLAEGSAGIESSQLHHLQLLLARGTLPADVRWMAQHPGWLGPLQGSLASVRWLRQMHTVLAARKLPADELLGSVLARTTSAAGFAFQRSWQGWLSRLTAATATPRLAPMLRAALDELIYPALDHLNAHDLLQAWFQAAIVRRHSRDAASNWLTRIGRMQELVGATPSIPKSVRKRLDQRDAGARELDHLESLAADGRATAGQLARRDHLRAQLPTFIRNDNRLERAAEEAFIVIALDTLRTLVRRRAEALWSEFSAWQTSDVPFRRLLEFASWLRRMPAETRQVHSELLQAWREHGSGYKQHLAGNRDWLAQGTARGLDLRRWLRAEPEEREWNGGRVRLQFADDPRDIFLMGSFFGTCLSLSGVNGLSVVANAYDANKQVVYAFGERAGKRIALGRLLVAVNAEFELLRYDCYTRTGDVDSVANEQLESLLAEYAARRAQASGIKLTDEGEPHALAKLFWYDDGAQPWSKSTQAAWQEAETHSLLSTVTLVVSPQLVESAANALVG